jgi:CubicO group peptidase (beta-lactamase class C family)
MNSSLILALSSNTKSIPIDTVQLHKEVKQAIVDFDIPGVAVAIIQKDRIWINTSGYADIDKIIKVTENTIFRLGSISKTYLAVGIMQLIEKNEIELNDPVRSLLPDLQINNPWESSHPVRIIHLLEHTSSMDDVHFNEGYNSHGNHELSLKDVFSINPGSRNIRWQPGEYTSYSNDGFSILGLVIEEVYGLSFEEYIKTNITDRIDARSTSYLRSTDVGKFAQGYTSASIPLQYAPILMRPSGGINSDVGDLARFVQMLINNGQYNGVQIIDSVALNKMLHPSSSIPAREGFDLGYGSGFSSFIIDDHKYFGHGGGLPDFNSIFLMDPESNIGIVVLVNKNTDYFMKLVRKVLSHVQHETKTKPDNNYLHASGIHRNEICGYYTQANYGISLDRFPNYLLSGQELFIQNDTLFVKGFQTESKALLNVRGSAFRTKDSKYATFYFFKNEDGNMMLTELGKHFYVKDKKWIVIFQRIFLVFSVLIILSFILYFFSWSIIRLIHFIKWKKRVGLSWVSRLIPISAIIVLAFCLYFLTVWFKDYNNAGNLNLTSGLVFTLSILFPLLSLVSLAALFIKRAVKMNRKLERIYLTAVSLTLIFLSIFLYHYEIVGLRLWAY